MKLLGSVHVVRAIFPQTRVVNRNQGYDQLISLSHIATARILLLRPLHGRHNI